MKPRPDVSSTGYALADPGKRYLVYQPGSGPFSIDLRDAEGAFLGNWIDPATGASVSAPKVSGGRSMRFEPPTDGQAVLSLVRA
jgi:Putative collagen-binding domain of a collagenase